MDARPTPSPAGSDAPARHRRVAVIAVHGVGDQKAGRTAHDVADLLLRFHADSYQPFIQDETDIAVSRLPVEAEPASQRIPLWWRFDQRSAAIRRFHGATAPDIRPSPANISYEVMRDQLSGYEPSGEDQIYETIRLSGARRASPGSEAAEVHVFELFWADLSRVGSGAVRGLVELYQLLFDLCMLGRRSLDAALATNPTRKWWNQLRVCHLFTETMLTQPVLLLNVCTVMVVLLLLLPLLSPAGLKYFNFLVPAVLLAGMTAWFVARKATSVPARSWMATGLAVFLGLMAGLGLGWNMHTLVEGGRARLAPETLAALLGWLVLSGLYFVVLARYHARRPGVWMSGLSFYLASTLLLGWQMVAAPVHPENNAADHLVDVLLRTAEWQLAAIGIAWMLVWVGAIATFATGRLARGALGDETAAEAKRLRRSEWTAALTVILPPLVSLVLTVCIWGAAVALLVPVLQPVLASAVHTPAIFLFVPMLAPGCADVVVEGMRGAIGPYLPRTLLAVLVAALASAWALAPSVWGEVFISRPPPKEPDPADPLRAEATRRRRREWEHRAVWLGENLTAAFYSLRTVGNILRILIIASVSLTAVFLLLPELRNWLGSWLPGGQDFARWEARAAPAALLIGGYAILVLVASQGPLSFLALGFRSVLDVAFDVVAWLRVHPVGRNPRARITARFAGLLRHVCTWQHSAGGGYDALIIVTHSQGSVIAADVLRYFCRSADAAANLQLQRLRNGDLPVYLFTMGNPLRQLYAVRFPYLYGWARCDEGEETCLQPDPAELGVVQWVNAYRSGDYVGRALWQTEDAAGVWSRDRDQAFQNGARREFCIGPGAHTHYWDETAPAIAAELDELLVKAITGAKPPAAGP